MKIVSWNCRNGFDEVKAQAIQEAFPKADIFVIQECRRNDIYNFKNNWRFKNWYGDDQEYSDLGVAVFSKSYKVEFTDTFSRKFRYVVPYMVTVDNKKFTLFVVWTKPVPCYYDKNITQAICSPEYKSLLNGDVAIIGDFNTGYSEEHKERYSELCENLKEFKNCALGKSEEFKETFYSSKKKKLYLNDFCFVSESLAKGIKIEVHNNWEENDYGQKSWKGLSDHCPISVEFDI